MKKLGTKLKFKDVIALKNLHTKGSHYKHANLEKKVPSNSLLLVIKGKTISIGVWLECIVGTFGHGKT